MKGAMSIVALLILAVFSVSAEQAAATTPTDITDDGTKSRAFLELAESDFNRHDYIDNSTGFSNNVIKYTKTGDLAESLAFLFMLVAISICWIECCRGRKFF